MNSIRTSLFLLLIMFMPMLPISAQEHTPKKDSLKILIGKQELLQSDSTASVPAAIRIFNPKIDPAIGKETLSYDRINNLSISNYLFPRTAPSGIRFYGVGSDYIHSKSRTAVATYSPVSHMDIYSAATLGLVETPYFGKGNYYILNAGVSYLFAPNLRAGLSGSYNSNFNVLPFWNISANLHYMPHRNLMLGSNVSYLKTGANALKMNQSAVLVDLHARYRLSNDWFLNAYGGFPVMQHNNLPQAPRINNTHYGGTVEYWFQPTVGAEAGVIWIRDMFSGKMRAQPKLELKFRPGE